MGNQDKYKENSNPIVETNNPDKRQKYEDDFTNIEKSIINKQQSQQQQKQEEQLRPENPIDTAHLLLSDSELTKDIAGIDKEIKLSNLDSQEKALTYQFSSLYEDLKWIADQQEKKIIELNFLKSKSPISEKYIDYGKVLDEIEEMHTNISQKNPIFDEVGCLKKAVYIPVLSRGKEGFERIQQVKTISEYKMENIDKSEKKPGFMEMIKKARGGQR